METVETSLRALRDLTASQVKQAQMHTLAAHQTVGLHKSVSVFQDTQQSWGLSLSYTPHAHKIEYKITSLRLLWPSLAFAR